MAVHRLFPVLTRPVQVNGLNICLHLTELMPILRAYCGDPDPETRIASLRALRKLLVHAEPRLILPDRRQVREAHMIRRLTVDVTCFFF